MRTLIILVLGLLTVGCVITTITPEEQKYVGTYQQEGIPHLFFPYKLVLQKNGRVIGYTDIFGGKIKVKWKTVDGGIQTISTNGRLQVFPINPDGTLQATNFLIYKKIK